MFRTRAAPRGRPFFYNPRRMPVAVRIPRPPRHGFLDHLRARLTRDVKLIVEEDGPCDVLVDGTPDRARIEASVGLQAVVIPYAGVPRATRELLHAFPAVRVHNLHHAGTERLRAEALAEMLNGAARGAPMPHRVDLDRGY